MTTPTDYIQRITALDPTRSFAVTAPAGSGKTELLIQRILKLLSFCERPEEILAITFTRKAALEMQERVLKALEKAHSSEKPEETHHQLTWDLANAVLAQDKKHGWQLLENPKRLRIQTIDSFCHTIIQALPISAKIGNVNALTEDSEPLYEEAFIRLLDCFNEPSRYANDLKNILHHCDNRLDSVKNLMINLLYRRCQWLPTIGSGQDIPYLRKEMEKNLQAIIESHLKSVRNHLYSYENRLVPLLRYSGAQQESQEYSLLRELKELPSENHNHLTLWKQIQNILLTQSGHWRQKVDKRHGFPVGSTKEEKLICKDYKEKFLELLHELSFIQPLEKQLSKIDALPSPFYPEKQWALLESLTRLLPLLVAHLKIVFKEHGVIDYVENSLSALQALGNDDTPSDLGLHLDQKISHILVDEFQDTSSLQMSLLKKLTTGWGPGDGKTLFIVGDAMQSCYGFRDAHVGLFIAASESGIGAIQLHPIQLTANFRSQKAIVEWNNKVFEECFPNQKDINLGAIPFYRAEAQLNNRLPQPAVTLTLFPNTLHRNDEAKKIVQIIQDISDHAPNDSMAILIRNRSHLSEILPALKAANIAWKTTDIDPLSSRPVIQDLLVLTKCLHSLADRISWLSLLRGPLIGLTLSDLLAIVQYSPEQSLWSNLLSYSVIDNLTSTTKQRLSETVPLLLSALQNRQRMPLSIWIKQLWLELNNKNTENDGVIAQDPDADTFFDLLKKHSKRTQSLNLGALEKEINRGYLKTSSEQQCQLQIMTIHKAKGLEFDHVILPGLDRTPPPENRSLLLWEEHTFETGNNGLILGPIGEFGLEQDPIYHYLSQQKEEKRLLENTRLMYIACTRARNSLNLLANIKMDAANETQQDPSNHSLLARIWSSSIRAQSVNITL